ncbi:MAG TPA: Ku protein [Clostridiaceae bacterium]|jgi:DNA end-binding protein Ku|nr:Ku protein [Clostridiaceae bacterium]
MRPVWKGAISFGLVHIPIKLYPATSHKDIKFNYLHKEDMTPIKYKKHCPACSKDLEADEIVRGYEYESGKYVVLTDEDFEKIPLETTKSINIINFVNLSEVDPVYFDKSYYLAPNEGGQKAFELLRQAIEETGKVAIAKVVIRSKETLSAIRVKGSDIVMETMFYPDEIRNTAGIPELSYNVKIHENELKMAVNLITSLSEAFEPEKYSNDYRDALMELIQSKITGQEVETPQKLYEGNVVDLMEALRASIKMAKDGKKVEKSREKRNTS